MPETPIRRTFEIRNDGALLAYGDDAGIHYAPGESAETLIWRMHAWGALQIEGVDPPELSAWGMLMDFGGAVPNEVPVDVIELEP